MTCNVAVSIAKAAVESEHLRSLLVPQIVGPVVLAYLKQQYPNDSLYLVESAGRYALLYMGSYTILIEQGNIEVNDDEGNEDRTRFLVQELEAVLAELAGRLFQQEVQLVLQQALGSALTESTLAEVEYQGQRKQAATFTIMP